MDERKRLIKNTGIIAIGNISTQLVSFLLLPLYTGILSLAEYGEVDYIISISMFCIPFITMLMDESMFRFLIDCETEKERNRVISLSLLLIILGTSLFLIVSIPVLLIINYERMGLFLAYVISIICTTMTSALLRGLGKIESYSIYNFMLSIIKIALNIIFIAVFCWGVQGMLLATIIANICVTLFYLWKLKVWQYIYFSDIKLSDGKEMIRYSLPLIPNKLSWSIINLSDRILIMNVIGSSASGLYAVSCKFSNLMDTVYGFFYQSWKESSARALKEDDASIFYNQVYYYLKKFMFSVVLIMISFMPIVFKLLVNESYSEAILYIPILLVGTYFANISGFYGGIFTAYKNTNIMGVTTIYAAIINLVVNILLIWKFGIYAAALSTFIANLIVYLMRKKKVKQYIKLQEDVRESIIAIICCLVICIVFYSGKVWLTCIGCGVSIVYSIWSNIDIIKIVLGIVNKKKRSIAR